MDFVRSQGATTVALVGASMGGTASLVAAAQEGSDAAVVVTLSAPVSIEGLDADAAVLQRVDANKLFIAGLGDASAAASAQDLYEIAPPPKRVEISPADDHGTDLLTGSQGEAIQRLIETYLAAFAPA
jgi:dienelactone hydrolase